MARLGDLLKISTDSYKRLEVVGYSDKYIIVKNKDLNYYAISSDRRLEVGDVLFAATNAINKEDSLICNQQKKDYVVTIKVLARWNEVSSDFKKIIRSLPLAKASTKNNDTKTVSKNKNSKKHFIQPINKNGEMPQEYYNMIKKETSIRIVKPKRIKIIYTPMGGQKRY